MVTRDRSDDNDESEGSVVRTRVIEVMIKMKVKGWIVGNDGSVERGGCVGSDGRVGSDETSITLYFPTLFITSITPITPNTAITSNSSGTLISQCLPIFKHFYYYNPTLAYVMYVMGIMEVIEREPN